MNTINDIKNNSVTYESLHILSIVGVLKWAWAAPPQKRISIYINNDKTEIVPVSFVLKQLKKEYKIVPEIYKKNDRWFVKVKFDNQTRTYINKDKFVAVDRALCGAGWMIKREKSGHRYATFTNSRHNPYPINWKVAEKYHKKKMSYYVIGGNRKLTIQALQALTGYLFIETIRDYYEDFISNDVVFYVDNSNNVCSCSIDSEIFKRIKKKRTEINYKEMLDNYKKL